MFNTPTRPSGGMLLNFTFPGGPPISPHTDAVSLTEGFVAVAVLGDWTGGGELRLQNSNSPTGLTLIPTFTLIPTLTLILAIRG